MSAAILVALGATSVASAGGEPFTKSWSAIDVDGSVMTLSFDGSGSTRTVTLVDARATGCGGDPWAGDGIGTVEGNNIHVAGMAGCVGAERDAWNATLTYEPGLDGITDGSDSDVVWHRGNGAREAFLGVWKATDVDGSAMKLTFRAIDTLTREVSYLDDLASSCDPDAVFMAAGTGLIGSVPPWGRYITVSLQGSCVGGDPIAVADGMFRYDVETDTLRGPLNLDGSELVRGTVDWHRG
jgi:hypothetical protein